MTQPTPTTKAAHIAGRKARRAAEQEVTASPKPGLVCPDHQGAHHDMDHATFMASAAALEPYFALCFELGLELAGTPAPAAFPRLKALGQDAERSMFAVTNGVNTHKGLIFSLGLLCAARGRLHGLAPTPPLRLPSSPCPCAMLSAARTLTAEAAAFVPEVVERELAPLATRLPDRPLTAGERLYLEYGVSGIRGEASSAFPHALLALERLLKNQKSLGFQQALPQTLLELMCVVEDTNVLTRGGLQGLRFVQHGARAALAAGGMHSAVGRRAILRLRDACTARRLSPGGCADLLTLALFMRMTCSQDFDVTP